MKNRLMGILALASCVVLSGCGGNNEQPEEVKITIAELPTDLVEGSKIDLKDYITVSGGQGSYSINFDDESFEKITQESDTVLTLNEFGNVKFTVDYSGKSQEATLVVASKLMSDFANGVKNAGYDYGLLYEDSYDEMHWENYGEKFLVDAYYSDEAMGGYLEGPDQTVYSFELTYDEEEEPIFKFSLTGYEPESISDYSKPLSLPVDGYEVSVEEYLGEEYQLLTLKEDSTGRVRNIFEDFFAFDPDSIDEFLAAYNMVISSFQVSEIQLTNDDGEKIVGYDTYAMVRDNDSASETFGEEFYLGNSIILFDKDLLFYEDVAAYVASGEQPTSPYQLSVDEIANEVNKHNYTVSYDYGWYDCSVSKDGTQLIRGAKRTDNPFVNASTSGYYIHDYFNAIGGFNAYVSENKTFSDVPHENGYGLVNHADPDYEGAICGYEYSGNITDGFKSKKESTGFDLYDEENNFYYYNYQFLTGAEIDEYPSVYEKLFVNDEFNNKDGSITYSIGGASAFDLFDCLFLEAVNDGAFPEAEEGKNYPSYDKFVSLNNVAQFILEEGMYMYLEVSATEMYNDGNLTGVTFDFAWVDGEQKTNTYYQYVLTATLDFTSCNMPEFEVDFPAIG